MSLNKRSMHYRKKNLVFWLLMIIGTLTIAEFTLGISSLMSPRVAALLSQDQVEHVMLAPAVDRNGFRNKFVPDTVSIVALGDSPTYGVGVSRDQAWPQRLDTLSNVPTYNMGVPGWGPTQSLVILGQAMALMPKLIIEAFYAGNDLFDSYQHVYKAKQLSDLKTSDERVAKALTDAEKYRTIGQENLAGSGYPCWSNVFEGLSVRALQALRLTTSRKDRCE
jgi:hypothetical protein